MTLGLRIVVYPVKDLAQAKALYGRLLGVAPVITGWPRARRGHGATPGRGFGPAPPPWRGGRSATSRSRRWSTRCAVSPEDPQGDRTSIARTGTTRACTLAIATSPAG
jgi:hypothetical protein